MNSIHCTAQARRRGGAGFRTPFVPIFLTLTLLAGLPPAELRAQVAVGPPSAQTPGTPQAPAQAAPSASAKVATAAAKVETFVERAERRGTAFRLSLKDAMKMALQNNLSIAIQDYTEEIIRSRIFATTHVYEPHLITGLNWISSTSPNTTRFGQVEGANAFTNRNFSWSARLQQPLPYGGGYNLEYINNRITQLPPTNAALYSSRYGGNLQFTFTQPLLRDFKQNDKFRAIKLVRLDERINDTRFEEQVTLILKQVQDLYWDLVYAIQNQNILKRSLDLARVQLDNNRRKVEIGILAPIAITEASAEQAQRLQDMIAAENRINNMENNLKRALSNDRSSDIWPKDIIPVETPEVSPVTINMDEAISTALQRRPELRRNQIEQEKVDADYLYYKNQKKPRIDFNGIIGATGVAGIPVESAFIQRLDPTYSPYLFNCPQPGVPCTITQNPQPPATITGPNPRYPAQDFIGSVGALNRQLFSAPYRNYTVGIQIDIPLRNRPLEETLAQLSLQRRQNQKQLKDVEQMVVVEVRNALQSIQTNQQVVETAKEGYKLAQEQYEGENKRFQAGLSDTFRVLTYQRDLATAEGRLLQARIDYQKSINDLQKAKFTTIDQNDMEVARSQVPPSERQ